MNNLFAKASEAVPKISAQSIRFSFKGATGHIVGNGVADPLPRGRSDTLIERIERACANTSPDTLIGGALPFDPAEADCLWCAERARPAACDRAEAIATQGYSIAAEPSAEDFSASVAVALERMRRDNGWPGGLEKVVLARSLLVQAASEIPLDALMARLGVDPAVTAFRVALPCPEGRERDLCGATPELLASKNGATVISHPLAGSARRATDRTKDRAAGNLLLRSDKDRREHALVVEAIMDRLAPLCTQLSAPEGMRLSATQSMWHLGTRIEGKLSDPTIPSVVIASLLHPTPAVCGTPAPLAREVIRAIEQVPRGFYAGAVGWSDAKGDGAWYVAIRCAEISGSTARLFAGAGIVPGSDPRSETIETGAKFGALLAALGLPADAALEGLVQKNGET